ncbi:acc synthase, putative [Talaromyces stipitatus ATCC 10500]|uniref:Acc synthase, putative n=1 Tax=Talaromyces stipitatus (strain ATCC 10500 / CBS 375.48 / QM 6759 / NRRL 1006) TaxID=441959 RepID=B8MMF0_TALSN|nr:acc synthase, putative [Talaromyces stipitatus ATCC 10500]EED13704.1 acc synthase, putative [Talaromyces stipitatus ATCC 10500]
MANFHVSQRGAYNLKYRDNFEAQSARHQELWTPTNPNGRIFMDVAENSLLHDEVADFISRKIKIEPNDHLTYGSGPRGSLRLKKAAASFLENSFKGRDPVKSEDILVFPGLAGAIDAVTWAICDEGEGVLVCLPMYNGFNVDIPTRTGAVVVEVPFHSVDGYSGLEDVFDPDTNRRALEAAMDHAKKNGVSIRALLISQPHNPLGRCYPQETLLEMAAFCGRNGIHLISDEIYAHSVFDNPALHHWPVFTSILALDISSHIDKSMVHVLYGASKDFCVNGLRLGLLYSRNAALLGAISTNCVFSWVPHIVQDIWASMLEDHEWRKTFFAKNQSIMANNYALVIKFFKEQDIGFFHMNAATFVWVDLRRYMLPRNMRSRDAYPMLQVTDPNVGLYLEREAKVIRICSRNGVMIKPGSAYKTEELGWFRVTFTLPEHVLLEGLRRIRKSLKEIEKLGGDSTRL